jgi:Methylase involved in ubiquinone/menaquinone biosynthesis
MDKQDVIKFFDRLAPEWDTEAVHNDEVINTILDNAGIAEGVTVLDVGCGTGVLIPYYLERNVAHVTGVDISEKMIRIACGKFDDPRVIFCCSDAEATYFGNTFDCCVIYNAFPHFPDPYTLVRTMAINIKTGGSLTIAHGSSRDFIDRHHMEHAGSVSLKLMSDEELTALLSPYFEVTEMISNDRMQQIVGVKK